MWNDTCKIRINQHIPHYRLNGRSTGFCGKKTTAIWTKTTEETSKSLRYRSLGALIHEGAKAPVCKAHENRLRTSRTSRDFEVWYMIWSLGNGEATLRAVEPAPVPEKEVKVAKAETQADQEIKKLEAQLAGLKAGNEYKVTVTDSSGVVVDEEAWNKKTGL